MKRRSSATGRPRNSWGATGGSRSRGRHDRMVVAAHWSGSGSGPALRAVHPELHQRRLDAMIDTCNPASHLFIAIPAYDGRIHTETAAALVRSVPYAVKAGITVSTRFLSGSCFVDDVRNLLA